MLGKLQQRNSYLMPDFCCTKLTHLMECSRFCRPISLPFNLTPHLSSSFLHFSSSSPSPRSSKPSTLVLSGRSSSSSLSSSSSPPPMEIISTSVCTDGSIVFKFGDAVTDNLTTIRSPTGDDVYADLDFEERAVLDGEWRGTESTGGSHSSTKDESELVGVLYEAEYDETRAGTASAPPDPGLDDTSRDAAAFREVALVDSTSSPELAVGVATEVRVDASSTLQGGTDGSVGKNAILEASGPPTVDRTTTVIPKMEILVPEYILSSGAALLPHPSKDLTGIEDAYFISPRNWFGVADGIARWSLEGLHDGYYAQELMQNCEYIVSCEDNADLFDVKGVLKRSAAAAQSPGLASVLIAYVDCQVLHVANIGDTGICVVRNGYVCKKSYPMVHEIGFPVRIQQDDDSWQSLEFCQEYCVNIEDGDVIVIATDGLFDNLYEQEIASIVSKSVAGSMTCEEIADLLATRAQEVGRSASARTPFGDAAKAIGYMGYSGGKLDAVSVIVLLVERRWRSG